LESLSASSDALPTKLFSRAYASSNFRDSKQMKWHAEVFEEKRIDIALSLTPIAGCQTAAVVDT